jgi:hypothetical protein
MPEYLSPGVFVEEIPARLKAIEGVSTSTAGYVGEARRGTVPGVLPPVGNANGFVLTPDEAPVLVTSFGQYRRSFGDPPADPAVGGYLGHATRAFFENGGRRVFVCRAMRPAALFSNTPLDQGGFARLTRAIRAGDTEVFLNSLRSLDTAATFDVVRSDGTVLVGPIAITAYNPVSSSVTVAAASFPNPIDPARVAVRATRGRVRFSGPGTPAPGATTSESWCSAPTGRRCRW